MGLIDAIDRFDASRGVKFETYAVTRIRGYLIDQLRELDWLPRTARARVRSVQRASAAMEEQLGRSPDRRRAGGGGRPGDWWPASGRWRTAAARCSRWSASPTGTLRGTAPSLLIVW